MAFIDRVVANPGRFILVNADTNEELGTFDLVRSEGEIFTPGTLLNANNLNTLTQLDGAVKDLFTAAGMTSGIYQNEMSDALRFLLSKPETGTDNGWAYVKITSGIYIATRQVTPSLAINTVAGTLFTTNSDYALGLPSFSISPLFIAGDANGLRWLTMTNLGTAPRWRLYAPTSAEAATITIDFFAIGTY